MGVSVGQPGGAPGNTISNENLLTNMGLTSEGLTNQGDQNYLSFLGGVGQTQLSPNLLTDIASNNATMAAAPNPDSGSRTAAAADDAVFQHAPRPPIASGIDGYRGIGGNKTPPNGLTFTPPGGQLPTGGYVPLNV